jgi:CheY-like chemotaxis protein
MSEPTRQPSTATILLVDDEDFVRLMMRRILGGAGHRTVEAEDGLQALRALGRDGHGVRLVISDVAMPRMSGDELAAEIRTRWPELPVLLISGYARSISSDVEFLPKPFDSQALLRRVDALLSR